jgi:hypothetical protein
MLVPPIVWVAKRAKVGWHYADLVTKELRDSSKSLANLINPALIHDIKTANDGEYFCFLSDKEEMFLLSLRIEDRRRPNISYIQKLILAYGRIVSSSFILLWFNNRFGHSGRFKKPKMLPLEKFKNKNIIKYHEYIEKMEGLPNKMKFHFLNKKHLVNKDLLPNRT